MTVEIYNFRNWLAFIARLEKETSKLDFPERIEFLRRRLSSDVLKFIGHRLFPIQWKSNFNSPWRVCITILTRRLRSRDSSIKGESYNVKGWIESFQNQEMDSDELWNILTIQRTRNVVKDREQVKLFWNAHSMAAQKRLEDCSPFFNPEHEVWDESSGKPIEHINMRPELRESLRELSEALREAHYYGYPTRSSPSLHFTPGLLLLEYDISDKTISSEPQADPKDGHASGSSGGPKLPEMDEGREIVTLDGPKETSDSSTTLTTNVLEEPMALETPDDAIDVSETELANAPEALPSALPSADWTVIN